MTSVVRFSTSIASIIALSVLVSCTGSKKTANNYMDLKPIVVKSSDNDYRATPERIWDITHTHIKLSFNWLERSADGEAWIDIQPYRDYYSPDSIVLDAQGMEVEEVKQMSAGNGKPLNFKYKNDKLFIYDVKAAQHKLYIKYKALPYSSSTGGSKSITDDRGLYFINHDGKVPNKPMQIWTQGETQANSHWMPTIDVPNERFTTQIDLIVADSMTTLSNGKLAKQESLSNGMRMDSWEMDMPIQPYVVTFAIGKYTITKDFWRGREVSYYTEEEYTPYARSIFSNTTEMLEFFSDVTGVAYPWNKYSQIIVRDYVSGAMENTSASTFGEFVNQNDREIADRNYEDVVSHELFHQWFGDYATAESWSNITLNESFANYGEQLWRRFKYGMASEQQLAYDDLNVYLRSGQNTEEPLARYHYKSREDVFDRVSYQKGGAILRYLHGLIGDDAFSEAMKIYLTKNALQPAEIANWRLAIEEATGKDWHWFFNQWYMKGGHPTLTIDHEYDDEAQELKVTVAQTQNNNWGVYQLPLKTLLVNGKDKKIIDWNLKRKKEEFVYKYKNGQRPVIVPDVKHWLVGSIFEHKPSSAWKEQFVNVEQEDVISKLKAVYGNKLEKGKSPAEDYNEKEAILELAINDSNPFIREKALLILSGVKSEKSINSWKDKVAFIAQNDGDNSVVATAINALSNWKAEETILFYESLNSPSYLVAGAALNAIAKIDKDTAYNIAKVGLENNPKASLRNSIWTIIAERANADDLNLYDENKYSFTGNSRIFFVDNLTVFIAGIDDDLMVVEKSLKISEEVIATENIKSYRAAMVATMFELAYATKDGIANTRSNAQQDFEKKKLALIKSSIDRTIAAEQEQENLSQYDIYYKRIFGN
ncbi:MAG: M1 family metallopeptidase [Flavipsychrobacter sp.]